MPQIYGEHFRRKGTASRRTLVRFVEKEDEWPEDDDETDASTEQSTSSQERSSPSATGGDKKQETDKLTVLSSRDSFRSRRRRKKKNTNTNEQSSAEERGDDAVASETTVPREGEKGTLDNMTDTCMEVAVPNKEKGKPTRQIEGATEQDTPMPTEANPSTTLVTPNDDEQESAGCSTVTEKATDEKTVAGTSSVSSPSKMTETGEEQKKLSLKRKLPVEPSEPRRKKSRDQSVEFMEALTKASSSPRRMDAPATHGETAEQLESLTEGSDEALLPAEPQNDESAPAVTQESKDQCRIVELERKLAVAVEAKEMAESRVEEKEKELEVTKGFYEAQLTSAETNHQNALQSLQQWACVRENELLAKIAVQNNALLRASSQQGQEQQQVFAGLSALDAQQRLIQATEEISRLNRLISSYSGNLDVMEKQLKSVQGEKKQMEESYQTLRARLQAEKETENDEQQQQRSILEATKKKYAEIVVQKDEEMEAIRLSAEADLDRANGLTSDLEARLKAAEEKITEAEERQHAVLEASKKKYADIVVQKDEEMEAARLRAVEDLQRVNGLKSDLEARLRAAKEKMVKAEERHSRRCESLERNHEESVRSIKAKHRAEIKAQQAQVAALQLELANRADERKVMEEEYVQKQRDLEKAIADRESSLENDKQSFARHKSEVEARLRERERALRKRKEESKAQKHRRQANGSNTRERQSQETTTSSVERGDAKQSAARSSSSRGSSGSSRKKKTHKPSSSRPERAVNLVIPGQSLSLVGVLQAMTRKHGSARVVIGDPSDDSEMEL